MPRKPSIWYRTEVGAYYTRYKGKQHRLADGPDDASFGPTYEKAREEFKRLLELDSATDQKDRSPVRAVLELYLQHVEAKVSPTTFRLRRDTFKLFCLTFGEWECVKLTTHVVSRWADECRARQHGVRWGDASVRVCFTGLNAAFNWAVKGRLLTVNPLAGIDQPAARSRGVESVLADGESAVVLASAERALLPILQVMQQTGCRPSEACAFEARYFDQRLNAMVFHARVRAKKGAHQHKNAGKDKTRIILLGGDVLAMVKDRIRLFPSGPIFRTIHGQGWTGNGVAKAMQRLRDRVGMPHLTAYSFRHTFATRFLEANGSVDMLAQLMGNSPEVIRRHYSHLTMDSSTLRKLFDSFSERRANPLTGNDSDEPPSPDIVIPA